MAARHIPPGWSYDPSAWNQRIPIVIVATAGFVIAVYVSLIQYDLIGTVWEPFFGDGSREVLRSTQ